MPMVQQMEHPRSMDFRNQRKLFMLRTLQKQPWSKVLPQLETISKTTPSERQCRDVLKDFSTRLGRRKYAYQKCGRKAWKVTKEVQDFIVSRLLFLRKTQICTSTILQSEVARVKGVNLAASTVRKVLKKRGYLWLPRNHKPKYSKEDKARRLAFGHQGLAMTQEEIMKKVTMSHDGVILTLPPTDDVERENYCRVGETHCYRKRNEGMCPDLAGGDLYSHQVPYSRAVPLWGGVGAAGFGLVMFHQWKKVDQHVWSDVVESGKLVVACQAASGRQRGPWCILSDNESFLTAKRVRAAHAAKNITLWHVPPRSPDLNPVEQFWSKLRLWLRHLDLADLKAGRPPVQRADMKIRVRRLLCSAKARNVAKKIFGGFRRKCEQVVKTKGNAIRG